MEIDHQPRQDRNLDFIFLGIILRSPVFPVFLQAKPGHDFGFRFNKPIFPASACSYLKIHGWYLDLLPPDRESAHQRGR